MSDLTWPPRWQPEAIAALAPHVDGDHLVEIVVGDPVRSIDGSLLAGYVVTTERDELQIIHDRSGRPAVRPWPLLAGPVLRITARLPTRRREVIYAHPGWVGRRTRGT